MPRPLSSDQNRHSVFLYGWYDHYFALAMNCIFSQLALWKVGTDYRTTFTHPTLFRGCLHNTQSYTLKAKSNLFCSLASIDHVTLMIALVGIFLGLSSALIEMLSKRNKIMKLEEPV